MREIEFRGKGTCTSAFAGKWVFGSLVTRMGYVYIENGLGAYCEILPETVEQYTGLRDKNGTKIFEGDIVFANLGKDFIGKVIFEKTNFKIRVSDSMTIDLGCSFSFIKIIGNIHDKPEFLDGMLCGI